MNPGYAGRTELPESVKALFRPVMCIMPDKELICLISLFSDGFLTAKVSSVTQHLYKMYKHKLFFTHLTGFGKKNDRSV